MRFSRTVLGVAGLGLALGLSSFAMADEDAAATLAKAPPAVQAAAKQALGDKKLEEFDKEILDDKTTYEVGWKEGGVDHAAILDESGKLVQTEADTDADKLPAAVTDAVKKAHADGKIGEAATATSPDGKQYYSLDVKVGKEAHVLNVDANGKVLADMIEKADPSEAKEANEKDEKKGDKKD